MPSVALVLGGGGVIGGAFHAGAVSALQEATGWDARVADLIVGTSAGSTIAATLRLGFSPADHRNRATGRPLTPEGQQRAPKTPPHWESLPPAPPLANWLRPAAPWLAAAALVGRGAPRPMVALAGWAPRGTIDTSPIGDRIRMVAGDGWWPDQPTWITAVRLRDGKRTVFGRDDVEVSELAVAVQASSAVPGYFAPVRIGRHDYIDGGVHSPTNADLVAGLGFDLAVVISTMTATSRALRRDPRLVPRAYYTSVLRREVATVRARHTEVLVIQPDVHDVAVMGRNPMATGRAGAVADQAYESVCSFLGEDRVADRVEVLRAVAATGRTVHA